MLFLSFFSLPLSLEPACTLPSLLFLTWPEYPAIYLGLPSDSTRFALDPKKKGEISAPELGAWCDLGILFMSGVEWISVSWCRMDISLLDQGYSCDFRGEKILL